MHETYFAGGEFVRDIAIRPALRSTCPSLWLQDCQKLFLAHALLLLASRKSLMALSPWASVAFLRLAAMPDCPRFPISDQAFEHSALQNAIFYSARWSPDG
jgi:hypothetical protein